MPKLYTCWVWCQLIYTALALQSLEFLLVLPRWSLLQGTSKCWHLDGFWWFPYGFVGVYGCFKRFLVISWDIAISDCRCIMIQADCCGEEMHTDNMDMSPYVDLNVGSSWMFPKQTIQFGTGRSCCRIRIFTREMIRTKPCMWVVHLPTFWWYPNLVLTHSLMTILT